jgi:hypothetical protein
MKLGKRNTIILTIVVIIILLYFLKIYRKKNFEQNPTFHVLIATGGRESLQMMLNSLKTELKSNDAITVVFDGPNAKEKSKFHESWLQGFTCKVTILEQIPNLGFWGHGIRNKYQEKLNPKTTFVLHGDDDDIYVKGSFDKLRNQCKNSRTLYIARMQTKDKIIPDSSNELKVGNIGTPCGIVPSQFCGQSKWEHEYGGDGKYYINLTKYVENIEFLDTILYKVL